MDIRSGNMPSPQAELEDRKPETPLINSFQVPGLLCRGVAGRAWPSVCVRGALGVMADRGRAFWD